MTSDNMITETANTVLKKRYVQPGEIGWLDICERNAHHFAEDLVEENDFFTMIYNLDFLPNSPSLMNAGTSINSFSACFVLPVGDSIESIFKYYSDAGLISKSGGGVGASFNNIRATGSVVSSTDGVASGPVSFAIGQDALTDIIKQGGKRRGANMGVLRCDHADAWGWIKAKDEDGVLSNFNLSIAITDEFMGAVLCGHGPTADKCEEIWDGLIERAWRGGEPGVLFIDTANRANPTPHLGDFESTNPCGEQWLLPYESCNLGSINLSNFVQNEGTFDGRYVVDWIRLNLTVIKAVTYMNRMLDNSELPIPECQEAMEKTRKIGLGIMGLHDMLIQLRLPYDSEEGRRISGDVMEFIQDSAYRASEALVAPDYPAFAACTKETPRRNACLTSIQPTWTVSMIADCASGCEPYFAPVTVKMVMDGEEFEMPNKWVAKRMEEEGVEEFKFLSDEAKALFKGAQDIHWSDHVKMQAVLQRHVDSSISKTINMSSDATIQEVKDAYELAYNLGCKGVTVYRDGSRAEQVLSTGGGEVGAGNIPSDPEVLPEEGAGDETVHVSGCVKRELPDELDAKRYIVRDHKGKKVYFTVCHDEDLLPVEVFAKTSEHTVESYWSTIGRLISLALRWGIPLEDVTKQLRKSAGSVADTPAKLARILDKYNISEVKESLRDKRAGEISCPECPGILEMSGGCSHCPSCGWEKCA